MSLSSALSIATSSLANVNSQLALVSHNVANADTPGYVAETATQQSSTADGIGLGVVTGPATRDINPRCRRRRSSRTHGRRAADDPDRVAGDRRGAGHARPGRRHRQPARRAAGPVLHPAQRSVQPDAAGAVVSSAGTLATTINALSNAYTTQRQTAQNNIVSEVGTINTTLSTIGQLNAQIVTLQSGGQSTADLENQRDAAVQQLGQLVDVNDAGAAERQHADHHRRRRGAADRRHGRSAGPPAARMCCPARPIPAAAFRAITWTASTSRRSSPAASSAPTSRCATPRCRPTRPSWTSSRRTWPAGSPPRA